MLNEQIEDVKQYHERTFNPAYREVLKVMEAIEQGTEDILIPYNCMWKTKEYIEQIKKEEL